MRFPPDSNANYAWILHMLSHLKPLNGVAGFLLANGALGDSDTVDIRQKLIENDKLIVSPPEPAFHEHTSRGYTWQIIVRSKLRKALMDICDGLDQNYHVSIDPPGLL